MKLSTDLLPSNRPSRRRATLTGIGIFILCQIFFLIYIQFPVKVNFDEFHYVPAAKDFILGKAVRNYEHPPLGKIFMSLGIRMGGDRPFGWRLASTTAGALTLVGLYFLGLTLFRSAKWAEWLALLTFFNSFLYIQARIGLLDTFMAAFLVWGLVLLFGALTETHFNSRAKNLCVGSGVLFGLALGCKWPAAPALPLGVVFLILRFRKSAVLWSIGTLGILPILVYALALVPLLFMEGFSYHWYDFIKFHRDILGGLTSKNEPHFYESHWYQWPLMLRPIWFAFDREGPNDSSVRGVFLSGNPLFMWTGLVALVACTWSAWRDRVWEPFWLICLYLGFWLFWVPLPRRVSFFYYYYPSALILGLAIVYALRRYTALRPGFALFGLGLVVRALLPPTVPVKTELYWVLALFSAGAAFWFYDWSGRTQPAWRRGLPAWSNWIFTLSMIALFFYFLPISSGAKIETESFRNWMWFTFWI